MKLSIFTTVTDAEDRGDNWVDALDCYTELADEVIIVDGGESLPDFRLINYRNLEYVYHTWPKEFSWEFIGQQFQRGYEAATGDWVIHADLDFIFHERDFERIRREIEARPYAPAVSFYKWQFIQPHQYNLKSRLVLAVNKGHYGDRIKFNGGGDLCQPTLDGRELNIDLLPQAGIPFYNYEKLTKNRAQIKDDVGRMDRAYHRLHGKYLYGVDGSDESAFEGWMRMVIGRNSKPQEAIALEDHPKFVQETIKNLKPKQFGYNGFGSFKGGYHA